LSAADSTVFLEQFVGVTPSMHSRTRNVTMDEYTNARIDEWTNLRIKKILNERLYEWTIS